jgi:hypothetical protein
MSRDDQRRMTGSSTGYFACGEAGHFAHHRLAKMGYHLFN